MDTCLSEILYSNHLDIKKFERLLKYNTRGYKFFWLEAIMNLIQTKGKCIRFEEIVNEMIWNSWRTVTFYHLRLGPTINGSAENYLEHAIRILYESSKEELGNKNPSKERLFLLIKKYNNKILKDKENLTDYVPYCLISPFVNHKKAKGYLNSNSDTQQRRFIAYLNAFVKCDNNYFYNIIDADNALDRCVFMNEDWYNFMLQNYSVIMGWLQYKKAIYLQDRNPGVPGVVYKLSTKSEERRKSLEKVRSLWELTVDVTGRPLYEIYTGNTLDLDEFDLDHFVPWSFVCCDEIWNLTPVSKRLNSKKSNKLPPETYIDEFAKYNYYLYQLIFDEDEPIKSIRFKEQLEKCKKNHLNAIWAINTLYVPGNSKTQFVNTLKENLELVYNSAKLQEYEIWEI